MCGVGRPAVGPCAGSGFGRELSRTETRAQRAPKSACALARNKVWNWPLNLVECAGRVLRAGKLCLVRFRLTVALSRMPGILTGAAHRAEGGRGEVE
jgi:hypothetical protein